MNKTEIIPAAHYLPARKRGRPTLYSKFLERQPDMFPIELMAAHLDTLAPQPAARAPQARAVAEAAAIPPATNRGGKIAKAAEEAARTLETYLERACCDE